MSEGEEDRGQDTPAPPDPAASLAALTDLWLRKGIRPAPSSSARFPARPPSRPPLQ